MKSVFKIGLLLTAGFLIISCAGVHSSRTTQDKSGSYQEDQSVDAEKITALQEKLSALNDATDPDEARLVAETAIRYSAHLADEYRVVRPAVFHNILVRIGVRDRGLCWQWTEDLIKELISLSLKTFEFHWGVAYRGSDLREHNTVVITATGKPFQEGIVLDPWRNSGDLYWAAVKEDKYPWELLPLEEW